MKKISFWERLDIPESVVGRDEKLEQEITKLQGEFQKTKKQDELDEKIWLAHEKFRRGQVIRAHNLPELHTEFMTLVHKKGSIMELPQRMIEEKRGQREILVAPYKEETATLLKIEDSKVMNQYVCDFPDLAQTPSGRELDHRGYRRNLNSDIRYVKITTNARAILRVQELLIAAKGRIATAPSIKDLKTYLENLQREFDSIDWAAREIEVEESEFERLDKSRPSEVGYLYGDTIVKMKGVNP
jgi:hypothetical protein